MNMNTENNKSFVILIVDDNMHNLQVLGGILREQNYSVLVVQNGTSALKMMERVRPHLILLDIMMPDIDGIQVCTMLKQNEWTASIPVIFISAKNDEATIVQGFNVGGVDYISKPFIPSELLARVRHQLMIAQNEKSLLEIIDTKNKFFSIVAHDLKSPINQIIGLSEILPAKLEKEDYARAIQYAQHIHEAAINQFKLLENLLDWARIQLGVLSPRIELIFPLDLFNEVTSLYQLAIIQKHLSVKLNVTADSMKADPRLLQTIVRNLLSNAIKFTPADGYITIECYQKNQSSIITVKNTGQGLTEVEMDQLRSNETYIDSSQHRNPNRGTGLGLRICKELLKLQNGHLEIDSQYGQWTMFTVTLPR